MVQFHARSDWYRNHRNTSLSLWAWRGQSSPMRTTLVTALAVVFLASCVSSQETELGTVTPPAPSEGPGASPTGPGEGAPPQTTAPRAPACEATSPRPGNVEVVVTP